ncbi:uroporphyrinogen-III synthase [Candidatus Endowatersipora endosymbiont of Watersipora subatra]|uniref:uroporphyrinogen-III synthase n=1 Tax=Candidatus Endowatersipora endosymbiont of Watersipora subatra TaxID=3077946 RepID=UPI00312C8FFB
MKKILITRPYEQAQITEKILRKKGFDPIIEPMIRVKLLNNDLSQDMLLNSFDGAIITSYYAINALETIIPEHARRNFPVLAVGNATQKKLILAGFDDAQSSDGRAIDIALQAHWFFRGYHQESKNKTSYRILYPSAETTANNLSKMLSGSEINIINWPVYRTDPVNQFSPSLKVALREGWIDGILIYSSQTAGIFLKLLSNLEKTLEIPLSIPVVFCLSREIAAVFSQSQNISCKISSHPNQDSLLNLLKP